MARRNKTSTAEDWVEIASRLPWWAGLALAVVFYVVLHRVASQQVITAVQPGQMGEMVTQIAWKTLATYGQYILPVLCLAGAGVSAWRRHERQALVSGVVASKAADALDGMTWQQFEKLVGEAFCLQGYSVTEIGGGGADGGEFWGCTGYPACRGVQPLGSVSRG